MPFTPAQLQKLASMDNSAAEQLVLKKIATDTVALIKEAGMFDRLMGRNKPTPSPTPPSAPSAPSAPTTPSQKMDDTRMSEQSSVNKGVSDLRGSIEAALNLLNEVSPLANKQQENSNERKWFEQGIQRLEQEKKQTGQQIVQIVRQLITALKQLSQSQGGVGKISNLAKGILADWGMVTKQNGGQPTVQQLKAWAVNAAKQLGANKDNFEMRYDGSRGQGGTNFDQVAGDVSRNGPKNFGPGDPERMDGANPNTGSSVRTLPNGRFQARAGVVGKFYKSAKTDSNWGWKLA